MSKRDQVWANQSAVQRGVLQAQKRIQARNKKKLDELISKSTKLDVGDYDAEFPCRHTGFVGREIKDGNRFVCRECNARFYHHPSISDETALDAPPSPDLLVAMQDFRKGLTTLKEACDKANESVKDFQDAIVKHFQRNDNDGDGEHLDRRLTSLDVIDEVFATPGVPSEDLKQIWFESFPDITKIESFHDEANMQLVLTFSFIDGTKQRTINTYAELAAYTSSAVRGSGFDKFTQPIIRQNYPASISNIMKVKGPIK